MTGIGDWTWRSHYEENVAKCELLYQLHTRTKDGPLREALWTGLWALRMEAERALERWINEEPGPLPRVRSTIPRTDSYSFWEDGTVIPAPAKPPKRAAKPRSEARQGVE